MNFEKNWNELKKWLEKREFSSDYESYLIENYTTYTEVLSKMQELEQDKTKQDKTKQDKLIDSLYNKKEN